VVRQAFEQLRVAVGDSRGDLAEQLRTARMPEIG
jgi:hypothetical protein